MSLSEKTNLLLVFAGVNAELPNPFPNITPHLADSVLKLRVCLCLP